MLTGEQLKECGQDIAEGRNVSSLDWVAEARSYAKTYARLYGAVTIMDVYRAHPRPDDISPNCAGAVFKDKAFVRLGYIRNTKRSAHARVVAIWGIDHFGG